MKAVAVDSTQYPVLAPDTSKHYKPASEFDSRSSDVEDARWQSLDENERFVAEKPWKQIYPDVAKRMQLNGETPAQMAFADKIIAQAVDHSVDQPWEIDTNLMGADRYVLFTTVVMLVPKVIVLVGPTFLFTLPIVLLANMYGRAMPIPSDRPKPVPMCGCMPFRSFRYIVNPIMAVVVFIALVSLAWDLACHVLFGVPYWICRGCPSLTKSRAAIAPFRNGPSLLWYIWRDVYSCLGGQSLRHYRRSEGCGATVRGAFVISWHFTVMILIMPTLKYWMNANFWVYELGIRLVQQITTTMEDLGVPRCVKTAQKIISQSVQEVDIQNHIESWRFVPHYPYPMIGTSRRFSIGMQQGGKMFTLLVHTTHARMEVDGCTEQLLVSNSAQVPVYRVMLWHNNPYHFFTGFVEASISTGGSQTDKPDSGEHPMWLVSGHSPMTAGRLSITGTGMIDRFFDNWLPVFVEEMRRIATGDDAYAKAQHREVMSADGASVPLAPGQEAMDDPNMDRVQQGEQVIPDRDEIKKELERVQERAQQRLEEAKHKTGDLVQHTAERLETAAHEIGHKAKPLLRQTTDGVKHTCTAEGLTLKAKAATDGSGSGAEASAPASAAACGQDAI